MTEGVTAGDVIAAQVRKFRIEKGWSVRRLADECAKRGASQLTVDSLTNIERLAAGGPAKRGRRLVSIDEWLVLAHVLAVPPLLLLLDLKSGQEVAITPDVEIHPWLAWQ